MVEGRAVASALVFRAFLPPHPGPTALELGESTAIFSLSSDGGGGEGRGEESRFHWISPLPNPLPARSSQGEGDRRSAFQCLIQWPGASGLCYPNTNFRTGSQGATVGVLFFHSSFLSFRSICRSIMAITCSRSPLIGPNVAPHFPHLNEVRPSKRSVWARAVSSCGQKHERLRIMPEAPKVQRHLTPWNKSFLYSSQFGPLELRTLNKEAAKRTSTNTAAIKSSARSQTGTGTWLNTNHDRNHEAVAFIQDQTPGI